MKGGPVVSYASRIKKENLFSAIALFKKKKVLLKIGEKYKLTEAGLVVHPVTILKENLFFALCFVRVLNFS